MKVLLINPNSALLDNSWACRRFLTPIAPLGLAYLASFLEKNNIEVSIVDQFASKMPNKKLLELIKESRPEVIGFSALTPVIPNVKILAEAIRDLSKEIRIILGNLHGTCFPGEVLKDGIGDIVVRGEGEVTMLETCQRLAQGKDLLGLAGISFKSNGQIIHNVDRGLMDSLDDLPVPAWHLLNLDGYKEHPLVGINNARAFPILASRGCTYKCYYCSQGRIFDKVRIRDFNKVLDEMEYFNSTFNISFFGFCDAYFPFDEKSGLEFCSLMIERKLHKKIRWITETRVDKVTPRLLKAMKEAGAHLIMYGIEVGNERILKSVNKGAVLEDALLALKETRKAGILSQGLFMLGLPGETEETCRDTINFAKQVDPDLVKFNLATPYPGSKFFEDFKQKIRVNSSGNLTSWIDWADQSEGLVYVPENMDSEKLRYLQRMAMASFYIRPRIIFRHIMNRVISFENIFLGGMWLLSLFCFTIFKKLRSILWRLNPEKVKYKSV